MVQSRRAVCLILALVTLAIYSPVRDYGFLLYDDPQYVQDNAIVQKGLTWSGFKWAFNGQHANNWHPVTWLSHMLDSSLFGPYPSGPHLVNVIIHAINGALVFLLLSQITGWFWGAAVAAALFAWHPLRVESVAWISERKDVLSAFFGLLSLLSYLRYVRETRRRSLWNSVIFYALGVMAKPMLVTLPFLLLLLDYWPLQRLSRTHTNPRQGWQLVLEKWPFIIFSFVSCVLTVRAQSGEAIVPLEMLPMDSRVSNAFIAGVTYLGKMIWPTDLCVFYTYPAFLKIDWLKTFLAALTLLVITGVVWWKRKRQPWLLMGWLWFLGMLVPVIGLVQVGSQSMADRYTYLPMIGILIVVTVAVRDLLKCWPQAIKPASGFAVLVLGGCLFATSRQLPYWHDDITLFSHALAVTQDNAIANIDLGVALERLGKKKEAEACYREALRVAPYTGMAHNNLAGILRQLGQLPEAEKEYREAIRLRPGAGLTYANLGLLLVKMERYDEAMAAFGQAAERRPWDPFPYYLMGKTRMRQGRGGEAVIHFHAALRLYPNHLRTLTYLARLLATAETDDVRNATEAIAMAERANQLTQGQQPFTLDTLAAAYAEGKRFAEAVAIEQQAIALMAADQEADIVAEMQRRLKLYQAYQPVRESPSATTLDADYISATTSGS